MTERDPFEILRDELQRRDLGSIPYTSDQLDAITHHAMTAPPVRIRLPRTRRRRRWFIATGAIVALTTGGSLAVALLQKERVRHPDMGVACRAAADPHSTATVLPLDADPIAACAQLWRTGQLPDPDIQNPPSDPTLVACVGLGGALEVLPISDDRGCAAIGLQPADVDQAQHDPIVELHDRLDQTIGTVCTDPAEVAATARTILDELDLADWSVVLRDGNDRCGRFGIDADTHEVYIVPGPFI